MALLEVEGLHFFYRGQTQGPAILKDVNFKVEAGDFVAILGRSGSGKSTLFYILGALLRPSRGQVRYRGRDLTRLSDDELALFRNRELGFVFQQFHLLARTSVSENVLLPAHYPSEMSRPQARDEARAQQLIARLGLEGSEEKKPQQLSGGQQQRVAIARALLRDVDLILADEPTGNLDSENARKTLELLEELNREGKTIILITHDIEVAEKCRTLYVMQDGVLRLERQGTHSASKSEPVKASTSTRFSRVGRWGQVLRSALPLAFENLRRNKLKSVLTMLGVIIGIAAVLSMLTLGQFTKRKILQGYEALGVNTLVIRGWHNWERQATDNVSADFHFFDWEKDVLPLRRIFPQILKLSPVLQTWRSTVTFGGRAVSDEVKTLGVHPDYFTVTNRALALGAPLNSYHLEHRSSVCVLGASLAKRLFSYRSPLGEVVSVNNGENSIFPCRVIGVLTPQNSNREGWQPNWQVLVPFTYFVAVADPWEAEIHNLGFQLQNGTDVALMGRAIEKHFQQKYGKSGVFRVDSDTTLVAQMRKFLSLFTLLLVGIALLSLLVGGIGINNMMLVSVADRFKEIGLRKALGATSRSIRAQILLESLVLCALAGTIGVLVGFIGYEGLIFVGTRFVPKLEFEIVWETPAFVLSVASIALVGILSGLTPALRAEKLEIIEALRSE